MLGSKTALATVAVRDVAQSRKFYEETLGLTVSQEEGSDAVSYKAGTSNILVYRSEFAGTNRATAVTWNVGADIEAVVQSLRAKAISFEHYDMPGIRREGDIHLAGKLKNAWFKDPDGNIHALVSQD